MNRTGINSFLGALRLFDQASTKPAPDEFWERIQRLDDRRIFMIIKAMILKDVHTFQVPFKVHGVESDPIELKYAADKSSDHSPEAQYDRSMDNIVRGNGYLCSPQRLYEYLLPELNTDEMRELPTLKLPLSRSSRQVFHEIGWQTLGSIADHERYFQHLTTHTVEARCMLLVNGFNANFPEK